MELLPPPTRRAATSPLIPAITRYYLPFPFPSPSSGYLSTPSQPNLISCQNYFTKKLLFTNTGYQIFASSISHLPLAKEKFLYKFLCFLKDKHNPSLLPSLNLSTYNFKINVLFTPLHLAQLKTPMNPNLTNSFVRIKYYLTINDKFVEATRVFYIILLLRFKVKMPMGIAPKMLLCLSNHCLLS
jgi:hypothetical protein